MLSRVLGAALLLASSLLGVAAQSGVATGAPLAQARGPGPIKFNAAPAVVHTDSNVTPVQHAGVYSNLTTRAATFQNPIKRTDGSDPYIVYSGGYYYLTTTTWSNIQIARATSMNGLKSAAPKVVWSDNTASRCCNLWAPEIHMSFGKWYIYYTAGTSGTFDNQRLHVLEGSSTELWASTWKYSSRITLPGRDGWAIDATIMFLGGKQYLVYSSWDGANQCLWIAQMNSATTVGTSTKISTPTYSWEKVGAAVNEGAAMLYHGGRTFLVFSASNCAGTGYKLGRLELAAGGNPLSAGSWSKYGSPIFESGYGNYQPGHNGFFNGPSASGIWMVYHANSVTPGTCDGARYTMVQAVNWNSDGTPNLGSPRALDNNVPEPA